MSRTGEHFIITYVPPILAMLKSTFLQLPDDGLVLAVLQTCFILTQQIGPNENALAVGQEARAQNQPYAVFHYVLRHRDAFAEGITHRQLLLGLFYRVIP